MANGFSDNKVGSPAQSCVPLPPESPPPPETPPEEKPAEQPAPAEQKKTWIEIELLDEVTKEPIPNERYRIKLPDGRILDGRLDANGRARVDGIEPGTAQVCFPDIDANEWRPA